MALELKQDSKSINGTWWNWSVWVDGTEDELAEIAFVVYTLHPTFPDPIRTVRNAKNKFQLDETGWGEFEIVARVHRKAGKPVTLKVWLELETEKTSDVDLPRLFVSSSVADADFAEELSDALLQQQVELVSASDAEGGNPLTALKSTLSKASGMVLLVSDKPSPWLKTELELAKSLGLPVVPVNVGTTKPAGGTSFKRQQITFVKPDDARPVAKVIADSFKVPQTTKPTIFASEVELDGLISGEGLLPRKK